MYHCKGSSNTRSVSNSKRTIYVRTWSIIETIIIIIVTMRKCCSTFFDLLQNDLDQIPMDFHNIQDYVVIYTENTIHAVIITVVLSL